MSEVGQRVLTLSLDSGINVGSKIIDFEIFPDPTVLLKALRLFNSGIFSMGYRYFHLKSSFYKCRI